MNVSPCGFGLLLLAICLHYEPVDGIDMFGLINTLYFKADKDMDGIITEPELFDIYQGFDSDGDQKVAPQEFTPLWKEISGVSEEMAQAYFALADLDNSGFITEDDIKPAYYRFDTNSDGQVEAQEFNIKWQEIYREVPFVLLFIRTDKNGDKLLDATEYPHFFSTFNSRPHGDSSVSNADFNNSWVTYQYGRLQDAQALITAVDTDHNDIITIKEVGNFLHQFELSGNDRLEIVEVVQIVKLLPPL